MIWLAWRQFRPQALLGAGLVTAFAVWLVSLGLRIHTFHDERIAGCSHQTCGTARQDFLDAFGVPVALSGAVLLAVPALIGIFWGAPLVARELENGTHRLAWTQGVTRSRWLAVKLGLIVLATVLVSGVLVAALSWASQPYDAFAGSRFGAMTFGARGVAPIGYAVFAFLLGTTAGLLVRRTLPAMVVTLILLVAVQLVMPLLVRPHLLPSQSATLGAQQAAEDGRIDGLGMSTDGPQAPVEIFGYTRPGAWVLSGPSALVRSDGRAVTAGDLAKCQTGSMPGDFACLDEQGAMHFDVRYQPADRYWPFQGIETGIVLALGAALAGVAFRRIPHAAG